MNIQLRFMLQDKERATSPARSRAASAAGGSRDHDVAAANCHHTSLSSPKFLISSSRLAELGSVCPRPTTAFKKSAIVIRLSAGTTPANFVAGLVVKQPSASAAFLNVVARRRRRRF